MKIRMLFREFFLFAFIILLINFSVFPQAQNEITNRLAAYSFNNPQEKIYIHTDKPYYVAGEDIWFKVYIMTGPYHIPDTISSVVYVDLVNQKEKLIDRKVLRAREGLCWGDFKLPHNMPDGNYLIRAYTNYMRNFDPAFFFRKKLRIQSGISETGKDSSIKNRQDRDSLNIRFFPEGGDLVAGIQNYIAFKATDQNGKGVDVSGIVKNTSGDTITEFKSLKFGLGEFYLNPDPDENYKVVIGHINGVYDFDLPEIISEGYAMHIKKTGDNIYIWVRNNMGITMNGSFVVGQFRGFPFITIQGQPGQEYLYSVFSARDLPSGIIHFTFFDSLSIPYCERLVYHHNTKEKINFEIESDKDSYRKREKVNFELLCQDLNNNPILTNLSLSITNTSLIKPVPDRSHLLSYFNLESDLKGNIENPGYYFNPENEDRFELMNILMMTHGWRRFVWKTVLDETEIPTYFRPEIGLRIEGQLFDYYNTEKPDTGQVRIFVFDNQLYYNEVNTNEKGIFSFEGVTIYDSTEVVMNAWQQLEMKEGKRKKKKGAKINNDLVIRVRPDSWPDFYPENWPELEISPFSLEEYLAQNRYILKIDSAYDGKTVVLDELVVEDKKIIDNPFERAQKLYKNPSNRIIMDSLSVTDQSSLLFDLIRRYVPGVNISGSPPDVNITIRGATSITGNNQATILLDGMAVESDFIYYFPTSEIAFIDVLKTGSPVVYQDRTGSGVIAIYTREEPSYFEEDRRGIINFVFPGYYRAREFYAPEYDAPDERHIKPDYRRTLYWNPSVTSDNQGEADFSFFTSDETGQYRVDIQGMTYSGIPFVEEYYFSVK